MKKPPLLAIDCHYLCHRAFHTQRDLSWHGRATGVIYGFFSSILHLKQEFSTDRIAFCFESKRLYRREIYPTYKGTRLKRQAERTEKEKREYGELVVQIQQLRRRYLPAAGFANVFVQAGMEADDLLARIAADAAPDEEVILVTADSDLYQCLRPNVMIYVPTTKKLLTVGWFKRHYGLEPSKWDIVKAIAGCASDNIRGIKGVGEKTAIRYVNDQLPKDHAKYQSIVSQSGLAALADNRSLVRLPLPMCRPVTLREDNLSMAKWQALCRQLGFKSLLFTPPWFKK